MIERGADFGLFINRRKRKCPTKTMGKRLSDLRSEAHGWLRSISDTDSIRYVLIDTVDKIEFDEKSNFSFKEILLPLSQTLFFFTEEQVKAADLTGRRTANGCAFTCL